MIHKSIEIKNDVGLHARVAAVFVQTCSRYKSDIYIEKGGVQINAKSIMGIMALGASQGEQINIMVDGYDEEEAIKAIEDLLQNPE